MNNGKQKLCATFAYACAVIAVGLYLLTLIVLTLILKTSEQEVESGSALYTLIIFILVPTMLASVALSIATSWLGLKISAELKDGVFKKQRAAIAAALETVVAIIVAVTGVLAFGSSPLFIIFPIGGAAILALAITTVVITAKCKSAPEPTDDINII